MTVPKNRRRGIDDSNQSPWNKSPTFSKQLQRLGSIMWRAGRDCPVRGRWQKGSIVNDRLYGQNSRQVPWPLAAPAVAFGLYI